MAIYMPTDQDARAVLLQWAEQRLPYVANGFSRTHAKPIGVVRDGEIAAVVVYHNRRAAQVEAAVAASTARWLTPPVVAALLAWPFRALGVRRITIIIAERNERSQRLARGIGFTQEGKLHGWFKDDDAIMFGLTREQFERSRWSLMVAQPAAQAA